MNDISTFESLDDRSQGDFGSGFYTFALCDQVDDPRGIWAIKSARNWAINKYRAGYGTPYLLYYKIVRSEFNRLEHFKPLIPDLTQLYRRLGRMKLTGSPVVSGPALADNGTTILRHLPIQYKFEGRGTTLLKKHYFLKLTPMMIENPNYGIPL